jgi:hypothetical protein
MLTAWFSNVQYAQNAQVLEYNKSGHYKAPMFVVCDEHGDTFAATHLGSRPMEGYDDMVPVVTGELENVTLYTGDVLETALARVKQKPAEATLANVFAGVSNAGMVEEGKAFYAADCERRREEAVKTAALLGRLRR